MDLVVPTDRGLYCPAGDFYIDPWRPVQRALITHAHSDHARLGSEVYVCQRLTAPILIKRFGEVAVETVAYGETLTRDGVEVSFHPAGHVLGSAQIRIAHHGQVWVASGDYKLESDGVSAPVRAAALRHVHHRIDLRPADLPLAPAGRNDCAESTPGGARMPPAGRASVLFAYALGKAQRVLAHVDPSIGPIVCHGAIEPINALHRAGGRRLAADPDGGRDLKAEIRRRADPRAALGGGQPLARRFGDYSDALASGWMQVRGNRRRRGLDRGFVLSDHADWPGLLSAIGRPARARVRDAWVGRPAHALSFARMASTPGSARRPYGDEEEAAVDAPEDAP